ncbi:uncharacterized protein TNCV_2494401 [Trichonephila clavipes]|uniref:Uncharacterized protein n=1 Tax=Trichonephila clavipes TaxID=2585209 RepID=A0A8X6RUY5_TRICX|nr:uncharacterized protein TNCV_2494401 [Trichonephila clavipes]
MAPRSPDLTPADFWLCGYLKSRVYLSGPSSLSELKDAIRREVSSIHPDMLHSAVAGFVTRLECLLPCGGDGRSFNGLLCKAVSPSATFAFTLDALPDRFLSATDPVSLNRCSKSVMYLMLFHLNISAEMHLSHVNEIL